MKELPIYRVLCIDGGGMRGIYTAAYLDELGRRYAAHRDLDDVGLDLGKGFDLLVGTSTGAIIAAALAKGIAPATILKLYQEEGANIFPVKLPNGVNWVLGLRRIWCPCSGPTASRGGRHNAQYTSSPRPSKDIGLLRYRDGDGHRTNSGPVQSSGVESTLTPWPIRRRGEAPAKAQYSADFCRSLPVKVTHTLSSGIQLRQNFKDAVRFAVFQTGVDGWEYASHGGTVFIVCFRGRILALTGRHVLGDFDWRGLSITEKKFGRQLALPNSLHYPSDRRGHAVDTDIKDLAILGFADDVRASFFSDPPYIIDDNTIGTSRDGDQLLVNGNLKDSSDLSTPAIRPEFALLELRDVGAISPDATLRCAHGAFDNPALGRITGCSGAPVFNVTTQRLCGMALRGSLANGVCTLWYLDIFDILQCLTAIVDGRSNAAYKKTIRQRV